MAIPLPLNPEIFLRPTLNSMGYMYAKNNAYTDAYYKYIVSNGGPTLDIGVAFGYTTFKALACGVKVHANDICPQHLDIVKKECPDSYKKNLELVPGKFPTAVDFDENTFQSVLASRILHFLTGDELVEGLAKIFQWLKPGGKLFIIAESPYKKLFAPFIPTYKKRVLQNMSWPGEITNLSKYATGRMDHLQEFIHLLDDKTLGRELRNAGFKVEKISMFSKKSLPSDAQLDGRESVGAIAVKPE
ncbi:MAG: class I SAM-dependent methyltransferase [Alphaproteobacteria bacterium]|jgi:ubiquinone/menaquinone biosynthesis C-methylase UbiE|nr:class I SAM-dependent methyltransferase [Alphaproteobacteria bacterium]MBT5390506.1 class I SAM-dependent methyltransferase [Alphaproteobacteria bacterium]MBT5541175.1 class I SAM-dependent methyltransferase [Alphaproteobacteria bacterium]MBT5654290.1 class I SAM-dependent methyltransferase [Alphaproteobacteria bacterium]